MLRLMLQGTVCAIRSLQCVVLGPVVSLCDTKQANYRVRSFTLLLGATD